MADIFLGRVDKNVVMSDIEKYVKDTFDIIAQKVELVKIRSDQFHAFKITVFADERSKLFDAERWPEGIIINKFYKRGN